MYGDKTCDGEDNVGGVCAVGGIGLGIHVMGLLLLFSLLSLDALLLLICGFLVEGST